MFVFFTLFVISFLLMFDNDLRAVVDYFLILLFKYLTRGSIVTSVKFATRA